MAQQYRLACVRRGCGLPFCQLGCQCRVDAALVGEADYGGSGVAGSLVGLAFHREAVVAGSFDHTRVGTVTKGVEVPLRGDLTDEVAVELLLMVRGKNRPALRWYRGPAGRSG
jgi:hypothetical protein